MRRLSPADKEKLEKALDLVRECARRNDFSAFELIGTAKEALRPLGKAASRGVAELLSDFFERRDAGIHFVLAAADALPLTPELVAQVRRVAHSRAVFKGRPGEVENALMGGEDPENWLVTINFVIRDTARDILAKAPSA